MRASLTTSLKLREEEYSFINSMAKQCEGNGGSQLSGSAVCRAMIRLLQQLDVDVSGVKDEDQLLQRLKLAIESE